MKFVCVFPYVEGWFIEGISDGNGRSFEVEGKGVLQDLIPYVGQLVFLKVPLEIWVIITDEHGLLDCPGDAIGFPAYHGESPLYWGVLWTDCAGKWERAL